MTDLISLTNKEMLTMLHTASDQIENISATLQEGTFAAMTLNALSAHENIVACVQAMISESSTLSKLPNDVR